MPAPLRARPEADTAAAFNNFKVLYTRRLTYRRLLLERKTRAAHFFEYQLSAVCDLMVGQPNIPPQKMDPPGEVINLLVSDNQATGVFGRLWN